MFILLLVLLLFLASLGMRTENVLEHTLIWIEGIEVWESLLLILVYILTSIFFIPAFIVSLAAGFMLGVFPGVIVISVGTTLGAIASFVLARTVARGFVEQKLVDHHKFQSLDRAVGGQGFKVVLLSRIAPFLSYNALNYMYGISCVSTRDYILGTWLGMIPAALVLAFLGASAKSVPEILASPTSSVMQYPFLLITCAFLTASILFFLVRRIRVVFNRIEHPDRIAESKGHRAKGREQGR